MARD
jgi:hypothetical protein